MTRTRRAAARLLTALGLTCAVLAAPADQLSAQPYNRCGPQVDRIAPTVSSVALSTTSLDVSDHAQALTVTAHAADPNVSAYTGVRTIRVQIEGPRDSMEIRLALASGTRNDGTWTGTFTIPPTANSGDWNIRLVGVRDRTYNWTYYIREGKHPHGADDPRVQAGWTTEFTVSGTPSAPSYRPGKITSLHLSRDVVSTRHHPGSVVVRARFSDPQPKTARLMLLGKGTGRRLLVHRGLHLTNAGAWRRFVTIPQWHGSLSARLSLYLRYPDDVRPNYKSFRAPDLKAAGVTNRLTIHGPADTTAPTLDAFSFTPDAIDTTSGTEQLSVTATIHDAQAGPSIAYVAFFHHHHPPTRFSGGYGAGLHLTQQDGDSWSGSVTVPQCVGTHKWQADVYLYDAAGNIVHARPGRLADAGFPTKLSVTSAPVGDTQGPWVDASSAFAPDHSITLDFSEGVKNVSTDTLVVYDATPSPDRFTSTTPISAITCSDGTSTVDCDGSGGLATSAVLTVPSLLGAHRYAVYANPDPATVQLTDGVGNPITTSYEQVAGVKVS